MSATLTFSGWYRLQKEAQEFNQVVGQVAEHERHQHGDVQFLEDFGDVQQSYSAVVWPTHQLLQIFKYVTHYISTSAR